MELKRVKKYKAELPTETINTIRNILHKKLNLLLKEVHYKDQNSMFHSCRISICNDGIEKYNIGCNGKGMTPEYALASAYGEFIERLQNNMLFMHSHFARNRFVQEQRIISPNFYDEMIGKNRSLHFDYCPDESFTSSKDENELVIKKYVKVNCNEIADFVNDERLSLLPFCNIKTGKIEQLPIEFITHNCTSNGMCAGNTSKEALIQGLGEVLERYVIRLIYKDNLSLPTIPKEYFKGNTIYDNLIALEKSSNWKIELKDCSCDLKIPALGLLIRDLDNQQYHFRIGVDPSPITALERAVTEAHQGRDKIRFKEIDIAYQTKLMTDASLKEFEMFNSVHNASGHFPISIFLESECNDLLLFDKEYGVSDDTDLDKLSTLILEMGFDIYVRDTSFLNFPAFQIYVPGMSEIKNVFTDEQFKMHFKKTKDHFLTAHNLYNATDEEIEKLLNYLLWKGKNINVLIFLNDEDAYINLPEDLIFGILYLKIGKYLEASKQFKKVIPNMPNGTRKSFYSCIRDVLYFKNEKKNYDLLRGVYQESILETVIDIVETGTILEYFSFSSCFNCNECKISNSCHFTHIVDILKRIENVYIKNVPQQSEIISLFMKMDCNMIKM